jgi:hypothetical protein
MGLMQKCLNRKSRVALIKGDAVFYFFKYFIMKEEEVMPNFNSD